MSWSYSGNPASSKLDAVRFLISDTDTTDQLLSNEEINFALSEQSNNTYLAAAYCARALAAKFARMADSKSVGDLSISYSSRAQRLYELAALWERKAAVALCPPYAGGISISDKEIDDADTDRVQPGFKIDQHSYRSSQNPLTWKS